MASAFINPPLWDEKNKEFSLWLREAKAWKCATEGINGLKGVHGLQLALHLPEGSEIRRQIFDKFDTDEMKGDNGWNAIIDLLKLHYKKDDSTEAFNTWKEFRTLCRKQGQSIDEYIMYYEKYKTKMQRFDMNLGERIHGLNLLCGANLSDDELRIAMREVDSEIPDEMYKAAKKSLKKYFGSSAISSISTSKAAADYSLIKQETLFTSVEEYESYVAWKQYRNPQKNYSNPSHRDKRNYNHRNFNGQNNKSTYKRNPVGRDGVPLQCHICCSIAHFARECPHRPDNLDKNRDNQDRPNASYVVSNIIECDVSDSYASHAFNHMILDTGCPQNVAGNIWANDFIDTLDEKMCLKVKKYDSDSKFKFGGGRILKSLYLMEVPILLAGEQIIIKFDVVDSDIPLLLGKSTMKQWNLKINTGNDTAQLIVNNKLKEVELYTSVSGHWCINIQPCFPINAMSVLFSTKNLTKKEKTQAAEKLHRQFCHPPFTFLKKVLRNFDEVDNEFLDVLETHSNNCIVCKRYKPTIPKPAVGNLFDPDKMKFNQIVSIDLKQRNDKLIIYMIDVVTRYTRAAFIENKCKETVISKIIELWLSIFGAPELFLMDNGGEFGNDEMRELGNQFGIKIKHTAAYSPWANGLNERNHATVDIMMEKMLEDSPKLDENMALQYAVSIRNCCLYVKGFTPAQLAIGQNPRLPSTFTDRLPALEGCTTSPIILENLNAIANARKAFVQAETSAKLRKALKHPLRSYCDNVFKQGDNVFYKLPQDKRWQGPATVIGIDCKVIIIKHGTVTRRVHPCNLQHVDTSKNIIDKPTTSSEKQSNKQIYGQTDGDLDLADKNVNVPPDNTSFFPDEPTTDSDTVTPFAQTLNTELPQDNTLVPERGQTNANKIVPILLPKRDQIVKFKYPNEPWQTVTVLGLAGNRKGIYKNWVNVSDSTNSRSMDWSDVDQWEVINTADTENTETDNIGENVEHNLDDSDTDHSEHDSYFDTPENVDNVYFSFQSYNDDEYFEAKKEELNKWAKFNVYTEVDDKGQKRITGRWVFSQTLENGIYHPKARYVVRGFQEKSEIQSDSPTGSKECLRLILAIIASKQWTLNSIDIKAAFLQGREIDRDVYIVPPPESNVKEKLWKLDKCVYGLNDAARMWYFAVWEELEKLGCKRSSLDYGVFMWYHDNHLAGLFQTHVDDFLWAGSNEFKTNVLDPLCKKFQVGKAFSKTFKYVGINVSQENDKITLDQIDYINSIQPIPISRDRQSQHNDKCSDSESTCYRQLVGKLNWIANQSRPDICFDVCQLSSTMKTPTIADILKANKVLRKVKESPLIITFPNLSNIDKLTLKCYSDASLANLPSGSSTGGYVIFLAGENNSVSPVAWKSRVLRRVVRSTLSAETSAMIDALDLSYFMSQVLSEIIDPNICIDTTNKLVSTISIIAFTDNKSLYRNAHSTTMADEHRLRIDLAVIKQMLSRKELQSFTWVPAEKQLADCLTKQGASSLNLTRILENAYIN